MSTEIANITIIRSDEFFGVGRERYYFDNKFIFAGTGDNAYTYGVLDMLQLLAKRWNKSGYITMVNLDVDPDYDYCDWIDENFSKKKAKKFLNAARKNPQIEVTVLKIDMKDIVPK